jgi:hypothetical protein
MFCIAGFMINSILASQSAEGANWRGKRRIGNKRRKEMTKT